MLAGKVLPAVVPVAEFKIGMAICYDLRFPELFRYLAFQGADVMLLPSAWYAGTLKEDHWFTLLRARAIENTCYVVESIHWSKLLRPQRSVRSLRRADRRCG
jgi:predicted amidohydrolase